jgi:hypothetical protein
MFVVFDHTYEDWDKKRTKVNGAYTYSLDIAKFYLPHIKSLGKKAIISTAPPFNTCNFEAPLDDVEIAVQFLHKFPYLETERRQMIFNIMQWLEIRNFKGDLIIVTSYQSFKTYLQINFPTIKSVFFNMVVDVDELPTINNNVKKGIWFGNSYSKKDTYKRNIITEANKLSSPIDLLQDGHYNYGELTKPPHEILKSYKWGVGVGRCALEMLAMGMNVIVSGEHFGGLVSCEEDFIVQSNTNFNGRQITYDRDIYGCISKIVEDTQVFVPVDFVRSTIKQWTENNITKIHENF